MSRSHLRTASRTLGVVAVGAAMTATAASSPAFAAADPPPGGLPGVTAPNLAWAPCAEDAAYQCAPAQLPLDYRQPDGKKITLQLKKAPATDPAKRIGALFLHAGGPGGS